MGMSDDEEDEGGDKAEPEEVVDPEEESVEQVKDTASEGEVDEEKMDVDQEEEGEIEADADADVLGTE
ncbi:hypothetical protein H0H93_004410, partial [Arthromyces matolae]